MDLKKTSQKLTRREMLRNLALTGAAATLAACTPQTKPAAPVSPTQAPAIPPTQVPATAVPSSTTAAKPAATAASASTAAAPTQGAAKPTAGSSTAGSAYLSVVHGTDVAAITAAAIAALGGMGRFVKPGNDVVIKPNMCVGQWPEDKAYLYAATTNPEVVATIVKLCREAGAKRVRVMDNPFGGLAQDTYVRSGIDKAVKAAGGEMEIMNKNKFKDTPNPEAKDIKQWSMYAEIVNADVVINVPIAKHHSGAILTLGSKNMIGTCANMSAVHANLHQRIADLLCLVRPELTIIDAVRILMDHGPTGGNLNDVKQTNTIIASADTIAADSYATSLFGKKPTDIPYIQLGAQMKLGTTDLKSIKMEELSL